MANVRKKAHPNQAKAAAHQQALRLAEGYAEYWGAKLALDSRCRIDMTDDELRALVDVMMEEDRLEMRTSIIDCKCDGEGCRECDYTGGTEIELELVTLDDLRQEDENALDR